jgi:hypothetical protein
MKVLENNADIVNFDPVFNSVNTGYGTKSNE